jgi:hypothetical protein
VGFYPTDKIGQDQMATNENEMPNAAVIEMGAKRSGGRIPSKQVGRHTVGRNIVAKCRPVKWYAPREIAKIIGATEDDARRIVGRLCSRPAYGARAERKRVGTETHYRIFKQDKMVSVEELIERLSPIIEHLEEEGRKNVATMSSNTVAHLAALLKRQLAEWTK